MNIVFFIYKKLLRLFCCLLVFTLLGCSQEADDGRNGKTAGKTIAIPIEIDGLRTNWTKSIDSQPHTVNRVFILPFKKIDEGISANDDSNFAPDYAIAKQFDFNTVTLYTAMLNFEVGATYKVMVIGYNQADYDYNNPGGLGERFVIDSVATPSLFSNIHLLLTHAADVPEFFTAISRSYNDGSLVGIYFKPEQIKTLKATMTRLSSGLNLEIAHIPAFVDTITLVAETLVKGILLADSTATVVQLPTDADNLKTFSSQAPVSGSVSFSHFVLPTFDVGKTKLYLDVKYEGNTDRDTIRVQDLEGVSSDNSILFLPNQVVKISGDFSALNNAFDIEHSIHLDDDAWDGIQ